MQYIVYVVAFLSSLGQSLVALAMPVMAIDRFGALNFHLGLLGAGASGVYTLVALSSGRISERLPIRLQLAVCTFVLATSYCVMFHAPSFAVLLSLNVLNGVATGLLWAPLEGVLSRLSEPMHMRRNVGRYNLSWSLGMAAGFYLYSHVTKMAFQAGAAMVFATGIMFLFLRAPHAGWQPTYEDSQNSDPQRDRQGRFFLLIAWSGLFASYVVVAAIRQLFPKLTTELGISREIMGSIYGTGIIAQTVAMAAMGRFQGWHYRKEAFYCGEIGIVAGAMLIALGNETLILTAGHVVVGLSMAVLYSCSLFYSMQDPGRAHHNTSVHEGLIGTAATTPVLLGYVADRFHFTPLSFYTAGGIGLVFLGAHLVLFNRRKTEL